MVDLNIQQVVRDTLWLNIRQDYAIYIEPERISKRSGKKRYFEFFGDYHYFPEEKRYENFHVFQFGQITPHLLKLIVRPYEWMIPKWVSSLDLLNQTTTLLEVYNSQGVHVPKKDIYYRYTRRGNLFFIIRERKTVPIDYRDDTLFFRIYTNAYHQALAEQLGNKSLMGNSKTLTTEDEILNWHNEIRDQLTQYPIQTLCWVNGIRKEDLSVDDYQYGDTVDWITDLSIRDRTHYPLTSSPVYTSLVTNRYRSVVHLPRYPEHTLLSLDDVDVYLVHLESDKVKSGTLIIPHGEDQPKPLTHRDYSVDSVVITQCQDQLEQDLKDTLDISELWIESVVRYSGEYPNLPYEHQRLRELDKLPEEIWVDVLASTHYHFLPWRAETLETIPFHDLAKGILRQMDTETIIRVLGYHASTYYLANNFHKPVERSSRRLIDIPLFCQNNYTIYEYDKNGKLLGYSTDHNQPVYIVKDPDTEWVECLPGLALPYEDDPVGYDRVIFDPKKDYRIYVGRSGITQYDIIYEDITNQTDQYTITDNTFALNDDYPKYGLVETRIRQYNRILVNDFLLPLYEGVLLFPLISRKEINGQVVSEPVRLPAESLDIFLNGYKLIEDLDFFYKEGLVVITNKEYLTDDLDNTPQKIHVRYHGPCKEDLSREYYRDVGFVVNGQLSLNQRYNLRDDRPVLLSLYGRVIPKSNLSSALDESQQIIPVDEYYNGKPYEIKETFIPIKEHTGIDSFILREESHQRDQEVEDFMTEIFKPPIDEQIQYHIYDHKYSIISPFFSRIVHDVVQGHIDPSRYTRFVRTDLTFRDVVEITAPYEVYLEWDPLTAENSVDDRFVDIHPHPYFTPITVNSDQYYFFEMINKHYFDGKVSLNLHFTITDQ